MGSVTTAELEELSCSCLQYKYEPSTSMICVAAVLAARTLNIANRGESVNKSDYLL